MNKSPNVIAAEQAARREVWNERYRLAVRNGFSDGDARLHAEQAVALHDQSLGGER